MLIDHLHLWLDNPVLRNRERIAGFGRNGNGMAIGIELDAPFGPAVAIQVAVHGNQVEIATQWAGQRPINPHVVAIKLGFAHPGIVETTCKAIHIAAQAAFTDEQPGALVIVAIDLRGVDVVADLEAFVGAVEAGRGCATPALADAVAVNPAPTCRHTASACQQALLALPFMEGAEEICDHQLRGRHND
ncbi:hypothetical protein D3C76_939610 [compost metagenome]